MSATTLLMTRLREETREAHKRTEATPLAQAMLHGTIRRAHYTLQLGAYLEVHETLEHCLGASGDPRLSSVMEHHTPRSPLLRADLGALGQRRPVPAAVRRVTEQGRGSIATAAPVELLGFLYVFAGSSLGASVLVGRIQAALELPDGCMRYYRGDGQETMRRWSEFGARMNALDLELDDQARVVFGANACFRWIGSLFDVLATSSEAASEGCDDRPASTTP